MSSPPPNEVLPFRAILLDAGFPAQDIRLEVDPPALWLSVGEPARRQGWKLHVSSRTDRVQDMIACAAPVLRGRLAPFKVAASMAKVELLNSARGGHSQVGKVMTIYPPDDREAVVLGELLAHELNGFPGPVIDNEIRLSPAAPVYARYGSFDNRKQRTKLGNEVRVIEGPEGELVPDRRTIPMHRALNVPSPFPTGVESSFGPLLEERFLIVGELVTTGHSVIYVGVDLDAGESCVLKVVKRHAGIDRLGRDYADRLDHEWQLLRSLGRLAAVPRPVAFFQNADHAHLVMETIDGETLFEHAREWEPHAIPWQIGRVRLVTQLLGHVRELHAAGVVLGDLSPTNILVEPTGALRIIDFEGASGPGRTSPPTSFGTHGYSHPRLFDGTTAAPEHDLYSLAAIIYYLVTGTDLSRIPQADELLRRGNLLDHPWRAIVHALVGVSPATVSAVLEDVERSLRAMLNGVPWRSPTLLDGAEDRDGDLATLRRQVAELGTTIAGLACRDGRPGMWVSRHPGSPGERQRDLFTGDAGIAYALLRIGLATGRTDLVAVAVEAAERLHAQAVGAEALPGLFIGEAGVGLLFLALGEVLGDASWINRGVEVSRRVARMAHDSPDLLHGLAGRGLLHIWAHGYTAESEDLAAAVAIARRLGETCERFPAGPFWRIPPGYGDLDADLLYGIAHGSAGIAYFLAELARASVDGWPISMLDEIAASLRQATRTNPATGLPDWPDAPDGPFRGGVWCHGSAGMALAFLQLHRALGQADLLDDAARAADSALALAHHIGPTQCHGLAGLLEVYLDLHAETGATRALNAARQLGEFLRSAYVVPTPSGPMISSEAPNVFTCDFMVGSGGGAAALARLLQPERFGHFLRAPREAFRLPGALPRQELDALLDGKGA
jgi:hypothetical protein